MTKEISEIIAKVKEAPAVALFSHVSPDGDCIGSMLALGLALEKMGKSIYYFNPDPLPKNLAFLPGASRIKNVLPDPWPKVLLFVDCADLQRVNLFLDKIPAEGIIINIDHHISNQKFGHLNWVVPVASASGEVVFSLIKELGNLLDTDIATNLYTALITDTGSFQYSNTTAQTHRYVAELMEQEIDLGYIHHHLFDQKPLARLKLLKRAIDNLEINKDGRFALTVLTRQDFAEVGAEDDLSEGLINHARTIEGIEVAVMLRETESGCVKAGFRSNQWLNVNEIAAEFGGGGHKRAAGCTFRLPLSEVKSRVVTAIEEALRVGWHN